MGLKPLGTAKVYRNEQGQLIVDKQSIRRRDELEGDDPFEGEDELEGEDGVEGDEEELGGREERQERRQGRRRRRQDNREDRQDNREDRRARRRGDGDNMEWATSILNGSANTATGSGEAITITIRPQTDFRAEDITFTGDNSATIGSISFGEHPVWSAGSSETPVSIFSSTGMVRGILKGQEIRGGLDIIIKGTSGAAGTLVATLVGKKPKTQRC